MAQEGNDLKRRKQQIRVRAAANRREQQDRDALSRHIRRMLADLPEYVAAATVLFYLDLPFEVRTRHLLAMAWESGKRVTLPCCVGERLELFRIDGFDELAPGAYGTTEPAAEYRDRADRKVDIGEVDVVVVPGVAFDRRGGRIGRGKGYYDKLLSNARRDTTFIALAFESQMVDEVPMLPHDVYMHKVITEKAIYERSRLL